MKHEISRMRELGTRVTSAPSPEERIHAIQDVVIRRSYAKIDDCMMDLYSANAIITVYKALSAENRAKFIAMPAPKMARLAFQILK
jgi:hypothetical protein